MDDTTDDDPCTCSGPHGTAALTEPLLARTLIIDTTRIRGGHVANLLWIVTSPNFDPVALDIESPVILAVTKLRIFLDPPAVMLDRYVFTDLHVGTTVVLRAATLETVEMPFTDWCIKNEVCPCRIR